MTFSFKWIVLTLQEKDINNNPLTWITMHWIMIAHKAERDLQSCVLGWAKKSYIDNLL